MAASFHPKEKNPPRFFVGADGIQTEDLLDADPWRLLALGILAMALEDYKSILRHGKVRYEEAETRPLTSRQAIEAFFKSEWAEDLAMGLYSGDEMISRLRDIGGERQ